MHTLKRFQQSYALFRRPTLLRNLATAVPLEPIVLRPYQESCLQACVEAFDDGIRRIGVSLPTGSGKTTVFVSLISRLPPRGHKEANRALIIVNSIELARQSAAQVERMFPHLSVEIEQGMKHKATGKADVTIATYQTLLQSQRLAKFDSSYLKAIVVDEAHHAAAPSYRRILGHFNSAISPEITIPPSPEEELMSIPVIGFSATFGRHDGISLGSVFQKIVYHRDFLEMIKEQWLCDVRFTAVQARLNLSEVTVNTRTGDFSATSLAHVINTDTVNKLVVQSWLDRAADRKSTLVFCVNLAHVRDLTNEFRSAGIDARYLHSGTHVAERKALLHAFRAGLFPVLVNCAILTEGADIPNIDCVVVARPTRSRNVFAQMIGRGMRLSPETGKTDCRIVDFVDSRSRVSGIVSVPTLFGLDIDDTLEDETIKSLEEKAVRIADAPVSGFRTSRMPEPESVTYVDYENPFALVHEASGSPHIRKLSSNAWVACGGEVYVLECLRKGHIRIEHLPDNDPSKGQPTFQAHFTATIFPEMASGPAAKAPKPALFRRSRKILTASSLADAVRGCDTYAKEQVMYGTLALSMLRSAKWRKTPATPGQIDFIKKRWLKAREETELKDTKFDNLTKGEAANIISRLKHGAHKRYAEKVKADAKQIAMIQKEMGRRARAEVKVGLLTVV
ncbi:hypothetical protein M422DRAFT_33262 [Sphaerobolus stellatus SS14]|uniref:P-loop containing nucleoside triphosphate hydrolase protein n=1 Tax=Sphaerobolus stellatus (strain SS14) TaxID=990650 RepID=A0A0C9VL26_SPHS4|nr:hypothetical protein M422DRAFT_33262 [Sphaerobolus stellatus SS14]